jgi:hypothetical protein
MLQGCIRMDERFYSRAEFSQQPGQLANALHASPHVAGERRAMWGWHGFCMENTRVEAFSGFGTTRVHAARKLL